MADAILRLGIQAWDLEGVGRLKHGHWDRVFHDVFRHLRSHRKRNAQQKQ